MSSFDTLNAHEISSALETLLDLTARERHDRATEAIQQVLGNASRWAKYHELSWAATSLAALEAAMLTRLSLRAIHDKLDTDPTLTQTCNLRADFRDRLRETALHANWKILCTRARPWTSNPAIKHNFLMGCTRIAQLRRDQAQQVDTISLFESKGRVQSVESTRASINGVELTDNAPGLLFHEHEGTLQLSSRSECLHVDLTNAIESLGRMSSSELKKLLESESTAEEAKGRTGLGQDSVAIQKGEATGVSRGEGLDGAAGGDRGTNSLGVSGGHGTEGAGRGAGAAVEGGERVGGERQGDEWWSMGQISATNSSTQRPFATRSKPRRVLHRRTLNGSGRSTFNKLQDIPEELTDHDFRIDFQAPSTLSRSEI